MITKVTKVSQSCGTYRVKVEGTNLTEEEILANREIRRYSTFGSSINICGNGTTAEVNCYYD